MSMRAAVVLISSLLLGGGDSPGPKKELEKFAGKWSVSQLTYDGEDHSKVVFHLTFKGEEAILEGDDEVKTEYGRFTIKINPATNPRSVDMHISAGVQKGATIEGIYEFKGDELRLCANVFAKGRPKDFASPAGDRIAVLVLKRSPR
jgi:uncharacterized protein (TIGR03067 family)